MRFFQFRDCIIENCSNWDGKSPYDPGPDVQMILESELPGLWVGDRVPEPASEQEPGAELEAEPEPEPEPVV